MNFIEMVISWLVDEWNNFVSIPSIVILGPKLGAGTQYAAGHLSVAMAMHFHHHFSRLDLMSQPDVVFGSGDSLSSLIYKKKGEGGLVSE